MGLCEDGADREWPNRPIYSDLGEELPSPLQFDCDCAYGHIQEYGDCGVEWDDVRQEEKMVLTLGEWDFEGDDCESVLEEAIDHTQEVFLALWKAKFAVRENQKNYGRCYIRKPWSAGE